MGDRNRRLKAFLGLVAAAALFAGPVRAAVPNVRSIAVGLGVEDLTRTVFWKGDPAASRIGGDVIAARADLGLARGILISFSAGIVLTDFRDLSFTRLPIGLAYDASPLLGLSFGAEVVAPLKKFSEFEIAGTGRIVYCFGMSRTWPLEGFAVDGSAEGRSSWLEAAVGPRLTYRPLKRLAPYLEAALRWLGASFRMTETLGDLDGTETKRVRGDLSLSAAAGADVILTGRLTLRAKAGVLPYRGGMDGLVSAGLAYTF